MVRASSRRRVLWCYVWLLLASAAFYNNNVVLAEDNGYDGSDQGHDENGNYYNKFSVCSDSAIVVEELSLLCSSRGAYYYGSGKYRNSATCQAGDKAVLAVTLNIVDDLEYNGYTPYINLKVKGYGTVEDVQVYQGDALCETDISSSDGSTCPGVGYYVIEHTFYWGDQSDSYSYSFKPKVIVGLNTNPQKNAYDLGGANTDLCAGDTFLNWTTGVRKSAANTLRTFFATFGILVAAVVAIFAAGWYVIRQANKRSSPAASPELLAEAVEPDSFNAMDNENDYQKMAMLSNNRNLVDF